MHDPFRGYDAWKTATPYDDVDEFCTICATDAAECKCDPCPDCGEQGNPACYIDLENKIFGACADPGVHPAELEDPDDLGDIVGELNVSDRS